MSNNRMDKFFREKLQQRKVKFDEGAWQEAEEMIRHQEGRRGRRNWLLWIPLLLIGIGGGVLLLEATMDLSSTFFTAQEVKNRTDEPSDITGSPTDAGALSQNQQPRSNNGSTGTIKAGNGEYQGAGNVAGNKLDRPSSDDISTAGGDRLERAGNVVDESAGTSNDIRVDRQEIGGSNQPGSIDLADVKLQKYPPNYVGLPVTGSPHEIPGDHDLRTKRKFRGSLSRFEAGITGGLQLSRPMRNGNPQDQKSSIWPAAGIYARYRMVSGLFLNAGIIYHPQSGISSDTAITHVTYDFGRVEEKVEIEAQTLHYLELPVYADVSFLGRQGITAGIQGAYLLNVASTVNASQIEYGYFQGFRKFDLQLILGYRFDYNERLRLQFRGHYGALDVTDNGYYKNSANDRNAGLKLMLQYRLY